MPSSTQQDSSSGAKFWRREYKVVFPDEGLTLDNLEGKWGLKIAFEVTKDLSQETNKLKLKIWNLTDESRAKVEKEDAAIELWVGYRENDGPVKVFTGSVIRGVSTDEGQNVVTEIQASDGQLPVRDTMVSLSYAPDTDAGIIVKAIAGEMGLPLVEGENVVYEAYDNGYSFVGRAADALDEICEGNGLDWSIQDGKLQVIMAGGVVADRGLVFSASSGLIGSPARIVKARPREDEEPPKRKGRQGQKKERPEEKAGWKIEALLSPTVNPGDAVKVESRMVNGWFRVESVRHTGESYQGQYRTMLDLVEGLE